MRVFQRSIYKYYAINCNFSARKTPVTQELRPHGDPAASLDKVKRQGTRSRVSYSAVTTQRHFHLSRWDRLEHNRTSCDVAHFKHAQGTRRGSVFWLTRSRNGVRSPWQHRKVSNSATRAPLARSRNAANRSVSRRSISQLRLHRDLSESFGMSQCLYRALTEHPQRLSELFFVWLRSHSDPKELLLRLSCSLGVSSAFISVCTALPRRF